jgi:hypothetical protein
MVCYHSGRFLHQATKLKRSLSKCKQVTTMVSTRQANHDNWTTIFLEASKNTDFKDEIKTYMGLPMNQDIDNIFSIYRDFGAGTGFLVNSPSTIVHVHDPFYIGASRKHPSTQSEWLAFAQVNTPTDVIKLDSMVGMITTTDLKAPKLATLVALTDTSAIPKPDEIADAYEDCRIPNIASLPPVLAAAAVNHLENPHNLLIELVAAIMAADKAHLDKEGSPPSKPLKFECKALLQWIWAVGQKALEPTDDDVLLLTRPEFTERAENHFNSISPFCRQNRLPTFPSHPATPGHPARRRLQK